MTGRKLSVRETWLLAILPASVILVVSFLLPNGKREVARLQSQIRSAPNDAQYTTQFRELTTQLNDARQHHEQLQHRRAAADAELARLDSPARLRLSRPLADCFRALSDRMAKTGVVIVATELATPEKHGDESLRRWELTLAGSWQQVSRALADDTLAPDGLVVASLKMHDVSLRSQIRRWTLIVAESEPA